MTDAERIAAVMFRCAAILFLFWRVGQIAVPLAWGAMGTGQALLSLAIFAPLAVILFAGSRVLARPRRWAPDRGE